MSEYNQRIASLIVKHLRKELNSEESAELRQWINENAGANQQLYNDLTNEKILEKELADFAAAKANTWDKISAGIQEDKVVPIRSNNFRKGIAVAAILLLTASAVYFWMQYSSKDTGENKVAVAPLKLEDIRPGSDGATLTLANGDKIVLGQVQTAGTVAVENGAKVIKSANGQLIYELTTRNATQDLPYNTITTSKGEQYKVLLSDGTQAWLNAASSISYPVTFTGLEQRKVSITGEVYFEVSPFRGSGGGKVPFIVNVAGKGEVEVLGTHFNINAYTDEATINTTLLEGSVKVHTTTASNMLKPGQQARFNPTGGLTITNDISLDDVMAWKNGKFSFQSATLETILRQAARWYDIEVVYEKGVPTDRFSGTFSRNFNLAQLLKTLEYSDVNVRLEKDRRLVIKQ